MLLAPDLKACMHWSRSQIQADIPNLTLRAVAHMANMADIHLKVFSITNSIHIASTVFLRVTVDITCDRREKDSLLTVVLDTDRQSQVYFQVVSVI